MANGSDGSIVIDTELDNEGFKQGSDKLIASVDKLAQRIDALGVNMQQSLSGITSILQTLSTAAQQSASGVNSGAQQATQAAQQTVQAAQQTAQAQQTATAATRGATQAATSYDKALAKLEKQIGTAKGRLAEYYQELEEIKNSTDKALTQTTSDDQAARVLEVEQIEIEHVNQKYAAKLAALSQLEAEYARVAAARDAANAPQQEATQTDTGGQTPGGEINDVSDAEQEATQRTSVFSYVLDGLRSVMGFVGKAALNLGKSIAKMGFHAISAGVKKAVASLKSFRSQAKQTTLTSNALVKSLTSIKRLLITRIKRMFISAIFNNVKEGIQQLAKFSASFNETMSGLKNDATQLSGNIAVTVGNIITALEPVITTIINLFSKAISYVNQFFALLNGKSTYTAAKKGTEDYAQAASGAADAQKEFNAELYGFDELTRQSKKNDSSSGADESAIQYEEVPVDLPKGVTDWVDRLKDAWNNQNWYGVGQVLADGLNTALGVADDWINNTLRPKGVEWAGRIATILNGLTDGINWPLLGKTIADGLNAIADIYNTFMYTYDWENLGKSLGSALNGLVDNVEWANIGKAFAAKWQALVQLIHGFVHETDWAKLGDGIGTAIYSWFTSIDWVKAADAIVTGFNDIVTTLRHTIQAINWGEVGTILANSIQTLITDINWGELGGLLSDAVLALLHLAMNLLTDIDWYAVGDSLGKGIVDMITNIDWLQILAVLGSCIISLVGGLVNLILGLIGGIATQLAEAFLSVGNDSIAGFFQGIAEKMSTAATWIKEHIVDPVVNAVKEFFGIHSPSTVFAELGGYLIQGLFNGISNAWHLITDFFSVALSGLSTALSTAWDKISTTAKTAWDGLKTKVTGAFTNAKTTLEKTASQLHSTLSKTWGNIKSTASTTWDNIKTSISNSFTNAKTSVLNTASTIKNNLSTAWSGIKSSAQTAWSNISSTASTSFANLSRSVSSAWGNLRTALGNVQWNNVGHNLVAGLANGISGAWGGLMSGVSNLVNGLISRIKSLFGVHSPSTVFAEIGGYLDEGLQQGMENGERGLASTAANIANAVTEGMTPDAPKVQMTADGVVGGMQAVISGLSGIAATFQTIVDALTAIGGFIMPQIAAGTVTPYSTRVDNNPTDTDDPDGVTSYLLSILSELQALARTVRNGETGQSGDIRVVINGHEVFQAVVDENNRAIRTLGKSPLRT